MEQGVTRRIVAGKYRLHQPLASGGMGSVWSAWNLHLDIPVAIKLMGVPVCASWELAARFEREARAAAQIRSPHVVQIFEHGIDDGMPFIVMELLEGEDLGTRMRRQGRLSIQSTAQIVASVCKALGRAHAMGIVHRDLKPSNIFIARTGDDGDEEDEIIKVLDFGIVKSLAEKVESGITKSGALIGTPAYMSPEQARSTKQIDHRTDLWSLGIVAYRALTGSLPFAEEDGIERLIRICKEPIPLPSSVAADIDPEVDEFFERALAIDPEDRFQTAREMSTALKALAGMPASSASPSSLSPSTEIAPPSTNVYTCQAYVYAPASQSEVSSPALSPLPSMTTSAPAPLDPKHDAPTRVSRVSVPAVKTSTPRDRTPVRLVRSALAEGSAPLPPLHHALSDTLASAGLEKAKAGHRTVLTPPRIALGAALLVVSMTALVTAWIDGDVGSVVAPSPHASGAPAKLLFTTTQVPITVETPPEHKLPSMPATSAGPTPTAAPLLPK